MELNIPIPKGTKSKAILKLLNPFLNTLSDTEINFVSTMIDMDLESLTGAKRAALRTKLKLGKYNFNNYVLFLKKKGVLLQTPTDLILNPRVKTLTDDTVYNITFTEAV